MSFWGTFSGGGAGTTGPAGTPGLVWRGPYNAAANYNVNDAVYFNGSSYMCTAACAGITPTTTANWQYLAQAGATGATGPQGVAGPQGATGPAGVQGPQGVQGNVGPAGATGATGPAGVQGPVGPTGPKGDPGSVGPAGPTGATGPQGSQGPTGATGPTGLNWQGAWTTGANYNVNDAVSYNGSSYRCIQYVSNASNAPNVNPSYWALLAQKGDTGPQGAAGPAGPQGATGPAGQQGATGPMGPAGPAGSGGGAAAVMRGYCNSAFTPPANAASVIPVDTKSFDTSGNSLDLPNHRIMPTVAGYYQVTGNVSFAGTPAEFFSIYLTKNGQSVASGTISPSTGSAEALVSDIVYCNGTTDYLQLNVWVTQTGALSLSPSNNFLSMALISAGSSSGGSSGSSNNGNAMRMHLAAAYTLGTAQTLYKIPFDTQDFDTSGNSVDVTNHRITPKQAGYYYVTANIGATTSSAVATAIYKNGVAEIQGEQGQGNSGNNYAAAVASGVVYCNGTTDYVEVWASSLVGNVALASGASSNTFSMVGPFGTVQAAVSYGLGVFMGGVSSSPANTSVALVDTYDTGAGTVQSAPALAVAKATGAGNSNSTLAVLMGGWAVSSGTCYGTVTKFNYSARTTTDSAASIASLAYRAGYGNASMAYALAGDNRPTLFKTADKYTYSSDTTVTAATTLTAYDPAHGAGNTTTGFLLGGSNGNGTSVQAVETRTYSSDAVAAGTALSTTPLNAGSASNASTALLFGGTVSGSPSTLTTNTSTYVFASGANAGSTALGTAQKYMTGFATPAKCYLGSGVDGTSVSLQTGVHVYDWTAATLVTGAALSGNRGLAAASGQSHGGL